MRKPNYRFERAERDRAKLAKKAEKLKRRQEERLGAPVEDGAPPPNDDDEPRET